MFPTPNIDFLTYSLRDYFQRRRPQDLKRQGRPHSLPISGSYALDRLIYLLGWLELLSKSLVRVALATPSSPSPKMEHLTLSVDASRTSCKSDMHVDVMSTITDLNLRLVLWLWNHPFYSLASYSYPPSWEVVFLGSGEHSQIWSRGNLFMSFGMPVLSCIKLRPKSTKKRRSFLAAILTPSKQERTCWPHSVSSNRFAQEGDRIDAETYQSAREHERSWSRCHEWWRSVGSSSVSTACCTSSDLLTNQHE